MNILLMKYIKKIFGIITYILKIIIMNNNILFEVL